MSNRVVSSMLRDAVRRGIVYKPNICEDCGGIFPINKIHGHHIDYSKPFDVRWLCNSCHRKYMDTKGKRNGFSKLTEEQVIEIRNAQGDDAEIAKKYGLERSTVSRLQRGVGWKHVDVKIPEVRHKSHGHQYRNAICGMSDDNAHILYHWKDVTCGECLKSYPYF